MRCRYSRMTGRRGRGRLLDELVEMTGWDRKHANKVLLGKRRTTGRRGKRGAPTRYGKKLTEALKICWLAMDQPCGKRMKGMLGLWLRHLDCCEEVRHQLTRVSAASIDRLLRDFKVAARKKARPPKQPVRSKPLWRFERKVGTCPRRDGLRLTPWPIAAATWVAISSGRLRVWRSRADGPSYAPFGTAGNKPVLRHLSQSGKASHFILQSFSGLP